MFSTPLSPCSDLGQAGKACGSQTAKENCRKARGCVFQPLGRPRKFLNAGGDEGKAATRLGDWVDVSKGKQKNCPVKGLVMQQAALLGKRENSEGRVSLCYWILSPVPKGYLSWTPNTEGKGWPSWHFH